MRFRSKPVEIEAVRWDGAGHGFFNGTRPVTALSQAGPEDPLTWLQRAAVNGALGDVLESGGKGIVVEGDNILVTTLEGVMRAQPGDWIIRGTEGELYPCKPSVFERKYEVIP